MYLENESADQNIAYWCTTFQFEVAKFGIRFSEKELLIQRNVGDLIADIERKLSGNA